MSAGGGVRPLARTYTRGRPRRAPPIRAGSSPLRRPTHDLGTACSGRVAPSPGRPRGRGGAGGGGGSGRDRLADPARGVATTWADLPAAPPVGTAAAGLGAPPLAKVMHTQPGRAHPAAHARDQWRCCLRTRANGCAVMAAVGAMVTAACDCRIGMSGGVRGVDAGAPGPGHGPRTAA